MYEIKFSRYQTNFASVIIIPFLIKGNRRWACNRTMEHAHILPVKQNWYFGLSFY